jgi:hypothetical protein
MNTEMYGGFLDELEQIAKHAGKIKSNDRMPARTKANVAQMMVGVRSLDEAHRKDALAFADKVTPTGLFELLHGMRRWYSGGTMARKMLEHRDALSSAMELEPEDAVGSYRGFKVPVGHELADVQEGQRLTLDVTRNHGISSWTTSPDRANKFSGGGNGKVGLVIKLVSSEGIKPILAPPERTAPWFNALYEKAIGKSWRPTEGEYLIAAPKVRVVVMRVKK